MPTFGSNVPTNRQFPQRSPQVETQEIERAQGIGADEKQLKAIAETSHQRTSLSTPTADKIPKIVEITSR